jgi:hypothetical protein
MKHFRILISFVCCIMHAQAQKEIAQQTHGWIMYFGNHKLTNKLSLHTEHQYRRADGFSKW